MGAYSNILNHTLYKKYYFIDGFAGTGYCKSEQTSKIIDGSAKIALDINPKFSKYFFIELSEKKVTKLEKLKILYPNLSLEIFQGDCNIEIEHVLQKIDNYEPFIALLDPQAGDLYWETIVKISKKQKSELLINFPFGMAINRYMPHKKAIDTKIKTKLNRIFGSDRWEAIYNERRKNTITPREARDKYLYIYLFGLKTLGFKYYAVKNIKNLNNVHIYYLIFATKHRKGLEKMKDSFVENESERQTWFFKTDLVDKIRGEFFEQPKISLNDILEKLLTGTHLYKVQDFKDALISLEEDKKLIRITNRPRARSFNKEDLFKIL